MLFLKEVISNTQKTVSNYPAFFITIKSKKLIFCSAKTLQYLSLTPDLKFVNQFSNPPLSEIREGKRFNLICDEIETRGECKTIFK